MTCHGVATGCQCLKCQAQQAKFYRGLTLNKTVRKEIQVLRDLGFVFSGRNARNRLCFWRADADDTTEIQLPIHPNNDGWVKPHRHRLAKMLDLNQHQLTRLIAGQPVGPKLRAVKNRPGPLTAAQSVMAHAAELGITLNELTAERLVTTHGNARAAKRVLDRMVEAAKRKKAA